MSKNELRECGIVQDLLPLYHDQVCSPSSQELVAAHLANCEQCRNMYENLKNHTLEHMIEQEGADVLKHHARKEKTAAYKAGLIIALLLLFPIIITLIVILSTGGDLGVFSVVTASMMLIAAFTVAPLIATKQKWVKSILAGTLALLLIYFFVDRMNGGGEFLLWSIPTIFGISVVLFPFAIRNAALPPVLSDKKALITMAWDSTWLYLTIFEVCHHSGDLQGMKSGCIIASIMLIGAWLIFAIARHAPANAWIKTGGILAICCLWTVFANDVYLLLAEHQRNLTLLSADFSNWSAASSINANTYVLILVLGIPISILLIVIGIIRERRRSSLKSSDTP